MKKIVLFKSPTCGICKLFKRELDKVCAELNIPLEEVDVSSPRGLELAQKHNINHSGYAWYEIDGDIKIKWDKPCQSSKIVESINAIG